MKEKTIQRRDFLKVLAFGSAAVGGLRLARFTSASETGGSSPYRWAMVIDQAKCTGCGRCTLACRAHNDVPPEISWNRVLKAGKVGDKQVYLPRPCMQCEEGEMEVGVKEEGENGKCARKERAVNKEGIKRK